MCTDVISEYYSAFKIFECMCYSKVMCGIAGKVSNYFNYSEINESLSRMEHRGPDDSGLLEISTDKWSLSLGQTRLSIIDLSQKGHQPFTSIDQRYVLLFNGEIYNYREIRELLTSKGYRFKSESDTEVLLNAWIHWGVDCIPKLKGMFAFVVYNKDKKLLTIVRDGFGIKPLFYYDSFENFAFASEIHALKSLIPAHLNLNNQRMFNYLAFGSQSVSDETFFDGVKVLEPGHILNLDLSGTKLKPSISRWWWPDITQDKFISETQAINEIRERFLENVRLHLISDVPLGASLSGGIDSSAIVCAMRYINPKLEIKTFSYVTPGNIKNEDSWIDIVNEQVGAIAHKVFISPSDLIDDLDDMIKFQGEPFGSTSIYAQYRVHKLAKESGITVILDGQGADELFAGYDGYPEWRVRSLISHGKFLESMNFLVNWSQGPDRSLGSAIENTMTNIFPKSLIPLARKISKRSIPHDFFNSDLMNKNGINPNSPLNALSEIGWNRALASRLRYALTKGGLSELLRNVDRNSMRWSIESRVPFLTTDFAEFILRLPEDGLVSKNGITKNYFRKAMIGIVPDQILARKDKIGFETPELDWLKFLKDDIDNWLDGLSEIPWVNKDGAKIYFQDVLAGNRKFSWQVWRLINAAKWSQLALLK